MSCDHRTEYTLVDDDESADVPHVEIACAKCGEVFEVREVTIDPTECDHPETETHPLPDFECPRPGCDCDDHRERICQRCFALVEVL
jgi:hypothetical protein